MISIEVGPEESSGLLRGTQSLIPCWVGKKRRCPRSMNGDIAKGRKETIHAHR